MIIHTVEGENVYVNSEQITNVRVDDKRKDLTLVTLACGTTLRTKDKIFRINGEDMGGVYD